MDFENIIIEYVKEVENVPHVGQMTVHVNISRAPIFDDERSMKVRYFSESLSERGGNLRSESTISYKSAKAEAYRQRMTVDIVLPHACLMDRVKPYRESRKATIKLLPEIIAEHEKMMAAR